MAAADAEPETGVGPTATRWPVLFAFSFLSGLNNFMYDKTMSDVQTVHPVEAATMQRSAKLKRS